LVQHLLVKEDDQKLLLDIQKRVAAGWKTWILQFN
jgi:hypothetical protein